MKELPQNPPDGAVESDSPLLDMLDRVRPMFRRLTRRRVVPGLLVVAWVGVVLMAMMAKQNKSAVKAPCSHAAVWLPTILRQEQNGQWSVATANAETALASPTLCSADRTALAEKGVADGLESLYADSYDPRDVVMQQQEVDRFFELKRQAATYGVPFASSLQVSQRAYEIGQFYLSKVAFEDAFRNGQVTTANQALLRLYDSAIYNLAYWRVQLGSSKIRSDGLKMLVTADTLDSCFHLGSGQPQAELSRQLGADPRRWPAPAPSPLLRSCPSALPSS